MGSIVSSSQAPCTVLSVLCCVHFSPVCQFQWRAEFTPTTRSAALADKEKADDAFQASLTKAGDNVYLYPEVKRLFGTSVFTYVRRHLEKEPAELYNTTFELFFAVNCHPLSFAFIAFLSEIHI
jgi:hypothetical protein